MWVKYDLISQKRLKRDLTSRPACVCKCVDSIQVDDFGACFQTAENVMTFRCVNSNNHDDTQGRSVLRGLTCMN